MRVLPKLSEIRSIAEERKYKVLPVSCEILSDFITPIEVIKVLKKVSKHCYMLESAQANETWGRFTFLGYDPKLEITCSRGHMKIGTLDIKTNDPAKYIRKILEDFKSPRFSYLPPFPVAWWGIFPLITWATASRGYVLMRMIRRTLRTLILCFLTK